MWRDFEILDRVAFVTSALNLAPDGSTVFLEGRLWSPLLVDLVQFEVRDLRVRKSTFIPYTRIRAYRLNPESRTVLHMIFRNPLASRELSHVHLHTPYGRMFEAYHIFDYPGAIAFLDSEMPADAIAELERKEVIKFAEDDAT